MSNSASRAEEGCLQRATVRLGGYWTERSVDRSVGWASAGARDETSPPLAEGGFPCQGVETRAAVLFVVRRQDVEAFAPHDESDGRLREMRRELVKDGVEAFAYNCQDSPEEVVLDEQVPVMPGGNSRRGGLGRGARRDGVPAHTVIRAG